MTTDEKLEIILRTVKQLERNQVPEIMTVPDCAKYRSRSEATIRLWLSKKSLPCYKRNGSIFFLKEDLIAWIKRGRIKTNFERFSKLLCE